jgi:hypothetical protein
MLEVDQASGKYWLGRVINLVLGYTVALGHCPRQHDQPARAKASKAQMSPRSACCRALM